MDNKQVENGSSIKVGLNAFNQWNKLNFLKNSLYQRRIFNLKGFSKINRQNYFHFTIIYPTHNLKLFHHSFTHSRRQNANIQKAFSLKIICILNFSFSPPHSMWIQSEARWKKKLNWMLSPFFFLLYVIKILLFSHSFPGRRTGLKKRKKKFMASILSFFFERQPHR